MRIAKRAEKIRDRGDHFEILTNAVLFKLWFVTDDIIRIRAGFDGDFDEASYSLMLTAWESRTDELFKNDRKRVEAAKAELELNVEDNTAGIIKGERLCVMVHKDPFYLSVYDKDGTLIHEDLPEIAYREDSNLRRIHSTVITRDDHFYGFGEKTGSLDKAGDYLRLTAGDSIGYDPEKTDGLYKHVPFFIRLSGKTKKAAGYFYHTTSCASFDMGKSLSNYRPLNAAFSADSGDIDLFLIAGPSIKDVIRRYTSLTGKPALLPKAALGYLGSSMYYAELKEKCDEGILAFTDIADQEGIPMDGFHLSSGYCSVDTEEGIKRCTFTWNKERFSDPAAWFKAMEEHKILVSANVKPGMLLVHPLYDEMSQKGMFVKDPEDPEKDAVGAWWGGPGSHVDFTKKEARDAWKTLLKEHLLAYGCRSVWNDNCEYDGMADLDSPVSFEGKGGTLGALKSVMANLMCLLSNEAAREYDPSIRPYSVCRAGHAGIQHFAQVWTGDNSTSWKSLKANLSTMLNMGLSGLANTGSDVGGFSGPHPEKELFLRWVQHGIFMPRFSIHSANSDNTVTEPWMYSDIKAVIRKAIRFRYQLGPYFYSLMYRAHEEGLPIMQPLLLNFQEDEACLNNASEFMLGDALLVANVLDKGEKERVIKLPKGAAFYDFYTREKIAGGQKITIPADLDSIPLFLVSGAVLPLRKELPEDKPVRMTDSYESLHLIIVPDRDASFTLYDDDGISNANEDGVYSKTLIEMEAPEDQKKPVRISFTKSGTYRNGVSRMLLDVVFPDKAPYAVSADGKVLPRFLYRPAFEEALEGWYYSSRLHSVLIKYPVADDGKEDKYEVLISREVSDLIGM